MSILVGPLLAQRLAVAIARGIMPELLRLVEQLLKTLPTVKGWLGVRMLV